MVPPSFDLGSPGIRPASAERLVPREWQSRLIQLLRARLVSAPPQGHDVLIHAGPGAGKTLGALLAFDQLRREGRLGRFVVFCHRSTIAGQWHGAAERLGLSLGAWEPESAAVETTGLLLTYQAAARNRERLRQELKGRMRGCRWLAIADEVHHLGMDPEEPDSSAWGLAFTALSSAAALRLGLSGTPFRADNLAFCAARRLRVEEGGEIGERIVPDLCVEPRRLILAGDVRPLEFRFQDGWVEHGRDPLRATETSPLSGEGRESWRARNLRRAVHPGDGGGIALRVLLQARSRLERLRVQHPEAGGLVIARDIAHARQIGSLLREQGETVQLVHSREGEAVQGLDAFRGGAGDWLVSVDMCAEGFDAPRIRVVAYLTTVVTRSRFVQAITRAVRVDGQRAALEPVPRHASYVFAPADPLLLGYARSWSLSEPYRIRPPRPADAGEAGAGAGGAPHPLPLQALADDAGAVIHLGGVQLPSFLRRGA